MMDCRMVGFSSVLYTVFAFYLAVVYGATNTLRLVNLVYRHGDRSPVHIYPNDPTPMSTWPDGLGWLTKEGKRMHYSLGRFLRRRYDGFLSREYSHTELTVESSNLDRCLMSAHSNLAGLYSPSGNQVWNENITWQPIPVHTRPTEEDNMLALHKSCPRYDQLHKASLKSERAKKMRTENKEILDFLSEKSGISLNFGTVFMVTDTVFCEKEHNVTLPSWINDTVYQQMIDLGAMAWDLMFHEKEESRLKGGPLLKEWLKLAEQKMTDEEYTTKMNMFSAHDSTVVALLSALGVYNKMNPPYTATVFMELHQGTSGDFYIELYFRNKTSQDPNDDTQPYPLTLQGCEFQCPYHQFVTLTKDAVPVDWDAECAIENHRNDNGVNYRRAFIITVAVGSVGVVFLIVVVLALSFRRNRRPKSGTV